MRREVNETVTGALRVCYGSCCHEVQTQEQHHQHALMQKLEKYREQAIEAKKEVEANEAFVNLHIVAAGLHHLQMWLLLKDDQMTEPALGVLAEPVDVEDPRR